MKPGREPAPVEVFDPHGDLTLVVGEDQVPFRVCSRALARSSPFWEARLYGPFSEGKAQQEGSGWKISLPDDRPEGLRILLSAVHGKFDDLPRAIVHDQLLYLTVLADKYDMIGVLKPYWKNWVGDPDHFKFDWFPTDRLVDYLPVCRNLGYGKGFYKALVSFVTRAARNDAGALSIDGLPLYLSLDDHPWLLGNLGTTSLDDGIPTQEALTTPTQKLWSQDARRCSKLFAARSKAPWSLSFSNPAAPTDRTLAIMPFWVLWKKS